MEAPLPGTAAYAESLRDYQDLAVDTEAIGLKALARYMRAFSRPGAMRAGFELYRADLERHGTLKLPVQAPAGARSAFAPMTEDMMREVADDVSFRTIDRANHWVPEENAEALAAAITASL